MQNETLPVTQAQSVVTVRPLDLQISDVAISRILDIKRFTDKTFKDGTDIGQIPGTQGPPVLLKPGAEKICAAFNVQPRYDILPSSVTDMEKGFFFYDVRCKLFHGEQCLGEGIGSANTKEKKYRYRWMFKNEVLNNPETDHLNLEKLPTKTTKSGYVMYRVDNDETYDVANTVLKMACKRAHVAAVLTTFGLSGFFTQDEEYFARVAEDTTRAERINPDGQPVNRRPAKKQTPVPAKNPTPSGMAGPDPSPAGGPGQSGEFGRSAKELPGTIAELLKTVMDWLRNEFGVEQKGIDYARLWLAKQFGVDQPEEIPETEIKRCRDLCAKALFKELLTENFIDIQRQE